MSEAAASSKMGRPSIYDPAIVAQIIEEIAEGVPLREICRREGMPSRRSVDMWRAADPELAARFARAREDGFDQIAEETLQIADDGKRDYVFEDGVFGVNQDHIQRARLRVDTRLKLLSKWDPKRYGERQQIDLDAKLEVQQADPASIANQLVTLGTQYPTLNPVIRDLAQSILDRLPALPG